MNNYKLISDIVNLFVEDETKAANILNRLIVCGATAPFTNERYVVRKSCDSSSEQISFVTNRTYCVGNSMYNFTDSDIGKTVFFVKRYPALSKTAEEYFTRCFFEMISDYVSGEIASKIVYALVSEKVSLPLFKVGERVLIVPDNGTAQPYIDTVVEIMGREYTTTTYRFNDDDLLSHRVEVVCGGPSDIEIAIANKKKNAPHFTLEKVSRDKMIGTLLGLYSFNTILNLLSIAEDKREFDNDEITIIMERTPQDDLYSLIIK